MPYGPDPRLAIPNPAVPSACFIRNVITRPNIQVGEYTYYDDPDGPERFEEHVTHHYEFLGDRLIIGKFCAIARGVEFVMNGANHRMASATTYPFNIFGGGWEKCTPALEELPYKGDTVVGSDVWIGQNVTVLPGARIGDGAIIGADSVVAGEIPPYAVAVGNPCRVRRRRFSDEVVERLLALRWWDWPPEKIFENLELLCDANVEKLLDLAP